MKKLKIFPKTFLYTLGLMLVIVLLSHALIYFLMPWAYNYQQEKALETDANTLADKIIAATPDERVTCVTDFAAKWNANAAVTYDDFSYSIDLLKLGTGTPPRSDGKTDFTIIADTTEDGVKISLAENPYGGADFFRVEQGFAGGAGTITAIVSRQHIEDAVGAVLMILPFTAVLCIAISVAFALAYSKMFTKPIKQISAVTEQMQELTPHVRCETDTQDEIGMLAENVNSLYQTLLSTIKDLEQEIQKVEAADVQKTNFLRAASHELKTPVTAVSAMLENMILNVDKYKDRDTLPFRKKRNHGEKTQYYVENSNPPIISREVFQAAQKLQESRVTVMKKGHSSPLSGILRCPDCGSTFRRQMLRETVYWMCSDKAAGATNCQSRRVRENAVFDAFCLMVNKLSAHRNDLLDTLIHQLEMMQNRGGESQEKIRQIDKQIADLSAQNLVIARLHTNGVLNGSDFAAQSSVISKKINALRLDRKKILAEDEDDELIYALKSLDDTLAGYVPGAPFDQQLFEGIVQSITVVDNARLTFHLIGGLALTELIPENARCRTA